MRNLPDCIRMVAFKIPILPLPDCCLMWTVFRYDVMNITDECLSADVVVSSEESLPEPVLQSCQ